MFYLLGLKYRHLKRQEGSKVRIISIKKGSKKLSSSALTTEENSSSDS